MVKFDDVRRDARRWWPAAVGMVAVVGLAWWLWPSAPTDPAPRARQYGEFTACLLTDGKGIAGSEAAPVWAGLEDAAEGTTAQVEFVVVSGPQTVENAITHLNGLAMGHCELIFAVGPVQVSAVQKAAGQFPAVRFFTVDAGTQASNISVISGDARSSVAGVVSAAMAGTSG